jgi:hypothetical protein
MGRCALCSDGSFVEELTAIPEIETAGCCETLAPMCERLAPMCETLAPMCETTVRDVPEYRSLFLHSLLDLKPAVG